MGNGIFNGDVAALKYKRLTQAAFAPRYATDGSGCYDLMASTEAVVPPCGSADIGTDIAFEVPPGYVMLVFSRSGHGFKHHIRLSNSVGVIDSDYRGEVRVSLASDGEEPFAVKPGDRIAQAMLVPIPRVALVEVAELSTTTRGIGGFGSTGN